MTMSTNERVAVVTGSNKGIGLGIVKALCAKFQPGIVYLTARDQARGEEAVKECEKLGLFPKFHVLDIDSLETIQKFAKYLRETHGGIDVLVNNAAIAFKRAATEPFGVQARETIRVNYFGTVNVCHELFPLLRKGARVVHVSSSEGHLYKINGKEPYAQQLRDQFASPELTEEKLAEMMTTFIKLAQEGQDSTYSNGWTKSTYAASKVGVSALTRIQQREIDSARPGENILINAVHPGYVDTDMTSHTGPLTVEEGAKSSVWCALLEEGAQTPRGGYVWCDSTVLDWTAQATPSLY